MKLIYVNPGDAGSVIESQVFSFLQYLQDNAGIEKIILLQGHKSKKEKMILQGKLNQYQLNTIWFKSYPNYSLFNYLAFKQISKTVDRIGGGEEGTIIHVRGEKYGAYVVNYLKRRGLPQNVLVDIRGAYIPEISEYYSTNNFLKADKLKIIKKCYNILKKNVLITVVSPALKQYMVTEFGFNPEKICIHPNIAGHQFKYDLEKRNYIRKKYSISNDDVVAVCSSGGGSKWQKDFQIINKLVEKNIKVFNLSPNKVDISGVINKVVPFKKMFMYLSAADIAILWRDSSIVNQVASPSKFSEFARMGLFVLHNSTVGIAVDYINATKSGQLISSIEEFSLEHYYNYKKQRNKMLKKGVEMFGIEKLSSSYVDTYYGIIEPDKSSKVPTS